MKTGHFLFHNADHSINYWTFVADEITQSMNHEGLYYATLEVADDFPAGYATLPGGNFPAVWNDNGVLRPESERPAPIPTAADVAAERDRRLAGGFNYDFGDARGVHTFGTTEADMKGWRDVTDYANALIALGDTTTTIGILTETGSAQVTALEWMAILDAAAMFRQPIWQASFVLTSMSPTPSDYANNVYWPA